MLFITFKFRVTQGGRITVCEDQEVQSIKLHPRSCLPQGVFKIRILIWQGSATNVSFFGNTLAILGSLLFYIMLISLPSFQEKKKYVITTLI